MDAADRKTLFVQIPAYRDAELLPTLVDMIERASSPQRLRVSVCWQHDTFDDPTRFMDGGFSVTRDVFKGRLRHTLRRRGATIQLFDYAMDESRGCGWARAMAQQGFCDEDYSLQIDSHHRFARHWDRDLIEMLEDLRCPAYPRPVLVGHPPAYVPGERMPERCEESHQMDFVAFGGLCVVRTRSTPIHPSATRPVRARFFSGGFAFADGSIVRDVPADPDHYFNTEEITLAVRAYTHGYDLFHPHRHVLWHYYGREGAPKVWEDQSLARARGETALDGGQLGVRAMAAVEAAFGMGNKPPVTVPWLGTRRTLAQYERYAGLCFARRAATPETLARLAPSDADQGLDEEAWEARLRAAPWIP